MLEVMLNVCHPSSWEVEVRELKIQGHPWQLLELEASLSSVRLSEKFQTTTTNNNNDKTVHKVWCDGTAGKSA